MALELALNVHQQYILNMSSVWDPDLERAGLRQPADYREFEKNSYTHRDPGVAVDTLNRFGQNLADRTTLTRHEIAQLAGAAFIAGQYWHDIQDMVTNLDNGVAEIGDLEDAAESVRRAEVAEEDAFLENKETRVILAAAILRIVENPGDTDARHIASALAINALNQYDICDMVDQPMTDEYFWQLVYGVHRPDSHDYNPTPEVRTVDRTTSSAYVALVSLARVVLDIDFQSVASPTGTVELTSEQCTDLCRDARAVAYFTDRMRNMADEVGLFYTWFGMQVEESYEEAQQMLADAHDTEIDYRVALIATAQVLADGTTDPKILALARQLAQAELDDAATAWEPKPKNRKQKLMSETY
jgi:hypothetical protein